MGIYEEICSHMELLWRPLTRQEVVDEVKKFKTRNEFRIKKPGYYGKARKMNILDEVCSHMISSSEANSLSSIYWTRELILEEAKKYKTVRCFRMKSSGAYFRAKKIGLLDEITKDMTKAFRWTRKLLRVEALKFNTRTKFQKNSSGVYSYALKIRKTDPDFFEDICSHMKSEDSQREFIYQQKYYTNLKLFFDKNKIKYEIHKEYYLGKRDTKVNNRVDFHIKLIEYDISFNIELKHDASYWSEKQLSNQRNRYNRCSRKKNHVDTYIVSPNGKYGFSEKEFLFVMENLINNEEILLYNSLNYVRNECLITI